ncbi:hypothetical protein ACHAQJ_004073 [Trichoderma viride]
MYCFEEDLSDSLNVANATDQVGNRLRNTHLYLFGFQLCQYELIGVQKACGNKVELVQLRFVCVTELRDDA